jgi:hypothetical protein
MKQRISGSVWSAAAATALLVAAGAHPAAAQDARTVPFVGCWSPAGGSGPDLCIERGPDGLVLVRSADGRETGREELALGTRREIERDGCTGTQDARFSADGRRILVRSEYLCEGGVERVESGILSLPASAGRLSRPGHEQLLDVRSVAMDGESVAWVQRYRFAADRGAREEGIRADVARRAAAGDLQPDDVIDAAELVDDEALQAWLAESGSDFDVDAGTLVTLADAGIGPDVLDVMIAVSHPEYFALAVDGSAAEAEWIERPAGDPRGFGARGWGFAPWGWGGGAFGWDPFFSPFGFNRFGLASPWGLWGGGGWGWGAGWGGGVVVVPDGGGQAVSGGRVVNGRGYRSGRSSTGAGRAARSGRSGGAATSRGTTRSGAAASGGSRSRGRSTGRTAKPRRGGGGGGGLF